MGDSDLNQSPRRSNQAKSTDPEKSAGKLGTLPMADGESRRSRLEGEGDQELANPAERRDLSKVGNREAHQTLEANKDILDFEQKLEQFKVEEEKEKFGVGVEANGRELKQSNEETATKGIQRQETAELIAL